MRGVDNCKCTVLFLTYLVLRLNLGFETQLVRLLILIATISTAVPSNEGILNNSGLNIRGDAVNLHFLEHDDISCRPIHEKHIYI